MKIWTKICGITRMEDGLAAVKAGADAIGINFWTGSARYCEPSRAAEIAAAVADSIDVYGVFVGESPERIADIVSRTGLTGVQLHGGEPDADAARVRELLGPDARLIRAVAVTSRAAVASALENASNWRVLLDNPRGGGTGACFDERLVEALDLSAAIVAGGLTVSNVAAIVARLRPYGVDTAGGVERTSGIKDHDKIREFIDHANAGAS